MEINEQSVYEYLTKTKAKNIALIDLSKDKRLAKYMFLLTMSSCQENKKFAEQVISDFALENQPEGYNKGEWIIIDLDEIIIHSFIPSTREKYNLDKLWQNKKIDIVKQSKKSKK